MSQSAVLTVDVSKNYEIGLTFKIENTDIENIAKCTVW